MIKRVMKRSFSIFLTLVLLATTFFIFDPSVLKMDASASLAVDANTMGSSMPAQIANAPETIYLKPGTNNFQYYSLIDVDTGDAGNSKSTSGSITFSNGKATATQLFVNNFWKKTSDNPDTYTDASSSISNFKPNSATLSTVSKLDGTSGGTTTSAIVNGSKITDTGASGNNTINFVFDSNRSTFVCNEGDVYVVEWGIEYKIDGVFHYTFLYTGFYKPRLTITGTTARGKHTTALTNVPKAAGFGFIAGAMKYAEVGNRTTAYTGSSFGTNCAPLVGFVGQQNNSSAGQYTIPNCDDGWKSETSFPSSGSPKTIMVTPGEYDAQGQSENYDVWTTYTNFGSYANPVPTGTNHSDVSSAGQMTTAGVYSGVAYEVVDTSRFTDLSQIPNFSAGYIRYFHERGGDEAKLNYIRVSDAPGTSPASNGFSVVGVDTSDHNDNEGEWKSRTYGLYPFGGSTASLSGQKNMYVMYRYSEDITVYDYPIQIHIGVGLSIYGVDKDALRQAYTRHLASNIDKVTYSSGYASYFSRLQTQMKYLCDPTATKNDVGIAEPEMETAQKGIIADNATKILTFYVPEVIYLNPSDQKTFQYYVDRANSTNGALRAGENTSGNVYLDVPGATNVSISASGATVSLGTSTGTSSISTTITSGSVSSAMADNATSLITWTASYTLNGITYQTNAYSVVYSPFVGTSSVAAAMACSSFLCTWHSDPHTSGTFWLTGGHSISTSGSKVDWDASHDNGWYSFYGNPLKSSTVITGGGTSDSKSEYPSGMVSGTGLLATKNTKDPDGSHADVYGGTMNITVDTSRYNNYSQIPNLKLGFDNNYHNHADKTEGSNAFQWDSDHADGNMDNNNLTGSYVTTFNPISDGSRTTHHVEGSIKSSVTFKGRFSSNYSSHGSAYCRARLFVFLNTTSVSKADLRNTLNNEIETGKQASYYTSASWTAYQNAIKAAYTALGNPTADQTTINNAKNGIGTAKDGLRKVAGKLTADHIGTDGRLLEDPTESKDYEAGDTTYADSNDYTGYTLTDAKQSFLDPAALAANTTSNGNASKKLTWDAATATITFKDTSGGSDNYNPYPGQGSDISNYYYVPVTPGRTVTITYTAAGSSPQFYAFYAGADMKTVTSAADGNWLQCKDGVSGNVTLSFTVPSDVYYLTFRMGNRTANGTTTFKNINLTISGDSHSLPITDGHAGDVITNNTHPHTHYTFIYTPNKYDVTYDTDGGSYNGHNDSYTYNDIAQYNAAFKVGAVTLGGNAVSDNPTKTGYTFNNWVCSQNQVAYNPNAQISSWVWDTDAVIFKAQWTPIEYNIAFNANDGTGSMNSINGVKYNEIVTLPANTFTRANYNFIGWNTAADGSGTSYADKESAGNFTSNNGTTVTLYAQWQVDSHKAKAFAYSNTATTDYANNATGGTVQVNSATAGATSEAEINYNASYTLKASAETGYYFNGWFDSSALSGNPLSTSASWSRTMGSGDANWYARFTVEQYNITMYRNYESTDSNVTNTLTGVKYGSSQTVTIPTRTGYTFNGWYSARTAGTQEYGKTSPITIKDHGSNNANISLYAQWTANTITVAYAPGTGSGSMSGTTFAYGSNFTPATCTFTAPASKKVTFNANGGSCSTASLDSVYTFNKWKSSANSALYAAGTATNDSLGASSGTVTLTAQWNQAAVTLPTPTRTGFTFKGWYDASSGGNKIGDAGSTYTPSANITLYAQWDVENHHVNAYAYSNTASNAAKWENNSTGGTVQVTNGTAGATSTGSFNYNVGYSVTAEAKTGYTFVGWYTAAPTNGTTWGTSTSSNESLSLTMGTADVVYYARFDVVTYAVTAKAYSNSASAQSTWANNTTGGSVQVTGGGVDGTAGSTSTGTVVSGSSTSLEATAATGYTFKGWFTTAPTSSSTASSTANPMSLSNVTAAATWYAKFDINTSTLTVKPNGGSWNSFTTDKSYTQAYGSTLSIPVPTRTGYTFSGWTKSGTFYGTLSSTTAAATYTFPANSGVTSTITAGWTAINYSISYALDGGTQGTNHPASAAYDTAFAVSAPTKTGYTFTGWTVTSGLDTNTAKWGTSSSPATAISATSTKCVNGTSDVYFKNIRSTTGSVTLTATWQIDTHTVTLVPYSNSANTPGTWTANDTTGGTVSGAGTFNYNADLSISASAKAGYNFDGWYSAAPTSGTTWDESKKVSSPATKMGTSNITYYAKFSIKSFTVTATAVADSATSTTLSTGNATAAGCTATPASSTVYYNKTASLTATAGTGYTFAGWFDNSACTGTALSTSATYTPTITEGKTFYAKFTIKSYAVAAKAYADTATSTTLSEANASAAGCKATASASTVKHGATVTLTATTGTGYEFKGWFDNASFSGTALSTATSYTPAITADKTFYAKFTIKSYTVSATAIANSATDAGFTAANASAAGCTATTSATSAKHGATVTLKATAATGYNFVGWFNNAAGTGSALSTAATYTPAITANSAFYAKFAIKNITVTFNENGGSVSSGSTTATAYYGTPVATPNVTKQGYALAGWAESATATTAKYPATSTINVDDLVLAGANKTLYAVWKPYEYTIVPMSASNSSANPTKYVVGTTGGTIAVKSGETIIPGDDIESKLNITRATGYDFVEVRYAVTTAPANGTDVTSWGTYSTSVTAEKTMPALPDGSTIVLIGYFKVRELNAKAYAYSNSVSSNNYTNSAAGGTVQVKGGVVDGTVGKESESAIYSGASVTFVAKAKTGYTFDGWYTAAPSGATWDESKKVASPATTMGASDITYYAKFSINTRTASAYAVYYDKGFDDAEGSGTKGIIGGTVTVSTADASATTTGSAAATIQAKYTQIVTYTADAATGYEFAGWYYDDDDDFVDGEVIETELSYDNFMPDENIVIQGKFVPINFVVVLNPNGGVSGPTAAITLTYGQPYTLDLTTEPIRTSYTFVGWSESSAENATAAYTYTNDTCTISAETINGWFTSGRTDIYAVWEIAKYIVTLDNQGGTGGLTQVEVTLNEAMPTLSEVPTLEGYTLAGYYNEPGGADASGKYYNADGTSAKNWDVAGDGILYAKWVCPVLKDATYDEATGKWTYIYEDVNGDDVSAKPSDEILTKDGISQNAPERAKQITSVDDAKTEYVKNKVDETQEINLNYYTQAALEQLYTNVTATNTDLKREDLTQVELNAYVANLARYTELEAGKNKKTDETIKPTINLYETKDKVKSIKDNTLTKNDSVIGNNYGKPTSNDAGTFVYTNKWSYYKEDAVDYYIYTNSRTPVIALEIDDGKVGSSVTTNKSSYPTNSVVEPDANSAVVADKEGSYMKSAVPATDDVNNAWFSRYTKANIGTKYDYNAKEIIYLTPSFTPTSPTSTTDEIVYTITPSDDATEKNEGLQSAQIAEIPSAQAGSFYSFGDDQKQGEGESITVCVCYHNAMNGTDDEGGAPGEEYFQMYIDQTDKDLAYADTWLNQMHLYRQSGGANNWEIVFADESVYPVEDETFKDTGFVLGSFAYVFDSTNESSATAYANAGNFEAAKKEIITSISNKASVAQKAILDNEDPGHIYKYGVGFFGLGGWSTNYYPKQGSYVYAHLIDRWGNVFNKVWKNFKVDDYTAVITGNAMNGFTVTEDGGSNVAIIEIGCDDVGFITDLDSSFENDIFTTSGDTFTVITNKPKSNVTFAVTDNAGNQIKGKVPTDAEGNIKLTVKDLCADLSDGAYVFMVNDKEVHLNACEPAIVRAASMPSTAFYGDEVLITIKTIDTVSKVQLDENGSTRTYTKTSSAATIVDNGDGTKTWTIKVTSFTKGDHTFAVKAKDNNVWYDSDFVLTTTITKRPSATKKAIISVENVNSYKNEKISVKVEVKPETSAVRVTYDPTGYTTTVGREDCTVETTENGTEIWTVPAMTFAKVGEYEINVFARYNSSWQTTLGETCKVTVTEKPVPGAVIYNVDISKTDLRRGELTTLTVTTNSVTSKLLLVYSGTTTTFSKTNAQVTTNEDGTLTWVIDKSFNTYGDIDIVFKAKSSALGWTEEQTFGTVTVTSSRAK